MAKAGPGRPRVYCGHSCRQQHYVERRTAVADGRDPDRVAVDRRALELFESRRLQLQLALDDLGRATRSGHDAPEEATQGELFDWIVEYARALVKTELS